MAQTVGVDIIRLRKWVATYAYCAAGRNVVLWRENAEEVWYEYSNAGGRPGHCPGAALFAGERGLHGHPLCHGGPALEAVGAGRFDLCLLDLTLPDGSGYDVCKAIKAKDDTPVIFLTAFDDEVNVVMGLELGADDYISKPFRLRELMARIKTVLRRSKGAAAEEIRISGLTVRMKEGKVLKNGQEVILTALEYKLLLTFLQNRGRVLSRNMLLESIWDVAGNFVSDNTLSVYIKRLREKIEDDPVEPQIIKTVRGMGYKVDE